MQFLQLGHLSAILALSGLFLVASTTSRAGAPNLRIGPHQQDGIPDFLPEKPLKTTLRLVSEDEVLTVLIDRWNAEGLHGPHGVIAWEQVQYDSWGRVFHKLMNRTSSSHWILLGELQLAHSAAASDRDSTRSFEHALRLDPSASGRVDAARARALARVADRAAANARARLEVNQGTRSPGGPGWLPIPWTPLSVEEAREAAEAQRAMVEKCLQHRGLDSFHAFESEWFLVFSDLPAMELALILEDLDTRLQQALAPLGRDPARSPFHSQLVLVICDDQDDFRGIEQACFHSSVLPQVAATCHATGPLIIINLHHDGDHSGVLASLMGQVFVAALHHHVSPAPLPRWASEGLRDHVVARSAADSSIDADLRLQGHRYIRSGGDPLSILKKSDLPATEAAPDQVSRAVAYLTCTLMMQENPTGFSDWIRSVKSGDPWEDALQTHYGSGLQEIARVTREWYLVND